MIMNANNITGKSEGASLAYKGTSHSGLGGKGFFVEPSLYQR